MSEPQSDNQRIAALESRLRRVEDRMEIIQLIASYGPAVDSRSSEATAALWTGNGCYDYGGPPLVGAKAVGDLVNLETHLGYVARGCAHVLGVPMITLDGDRAVATGYSRVYVHHGGTWTVARTSANRWELVRTGAGWKVGNRVNRLLDGSSEARDLLSAGLTDVRDGGAGA